MRALLALLLIVPLATAAVADPPHWVDWSVDGADSSLPVGGDIDTIRAAATTEGLHVQFTTFPAVAGGVESSSVRFTLTAGASHDVEFTWDVAPRLQVDGELATNWQAATGSDAGAWHLQMPWALFGLDADTPFTLAGLAAQTTPALDRASGPDLSFQSTATPGVFTVAAARFEAGTAIEGPDFAGGPSVTVDAAGVPLVAYYVYDGERGPATGLYLARVTQAGFSAQRIADTLVTGANGRDDQMRTQVAHDGDRPFVLFTSDPAVDNDPDGVGHLGTPDSVRVMALEDNVWVAEDPTPGGKSDVGPEDVADLAARGGKVVAAVPVGQDVWVVERTGPGKWQQLVALHEATDAKVALDGKGGIHVAYVVYPDDTMRSGKLWYASSDNGWTGRLMGEGIDAGWEGPETDGSFAIATGPADEVAILWNNGRARERDHEQVVAIHKDGRWSQYYAPLVPGHGNPQYTMRLGYDAAGLLVAASGYGGSDSIAVLDLAKGWRHGTLPRYDVFDMAVSPAGVTYLAYTQPHGGTTVAVTAYHTAAGNAFGLDQAELNEVLVPADSVAPGPAASWLALVLVAVAVLRRRSRAA